MAVQVLPLKLAVAIEHEWMHKIPNKKKNNRKWLRYDNKCGITLEEEKQDAEDNDWADEDSDGSHRREVMLAHIALKATSRIIKDDLESRRFFFLFLFFLYVGC